MIKEKKTHCSLSHKRKYFHYKMRENKIVIL